MAMLKFRRGTYAQITNRTTNPLENGTIYIATDEKAMYVDTATDRIRIGDFIRVDTVDKITPPYSTSSLYYVEADNALLKYDGTNWKQVNGTDDLKERLTTAENAIDAVEGLVGTKADEANATGSAFARIAQNKADIAALDTYVGTFTHDTAKTVVEYINAKTDGIATSGNLEALGNRVTVAEGKITTLEGKASDYENRISDLEDKDVALKSDVTAAKNAILGEADYTGTVKGAYEAAAAAQDQADKGVSDAAAAQTKATTNASAISALDGRLTALDLAGTGKVAVLESKVSALEAIDVATKAEAQGYANEVLGTSGDAAGTATVHGALKSAAAAQSAASAAAGAAATAQGRADDAYELAEGKTTAAAVKTQIEAYGYATTGQVSTAKQEAIDAAKTAGDEAYAAKDIENTVASHSNDLTTLKGDANVNGSVANAKKAGTDALALIGDANSGLTQTVNAHTTSLATLTGADNVNGSVANAKKAGTDAQATADANAEAIATLQGTVNKLDGDVNTAGSVKKQIKDAVDAAKTELSAEIDADIRAANAMEYVATINSADDLPTSAKNGATYVVGSTFGDYAAGDMLIAQGDEDPDTGLITNPTWAHVKSGYDATLDQQLTGAGNKIMLSNGVRNDADAAGAISFAATGSASVSVADNTVTIGMVWEDFPNEG